MDERQAELDGLRIRQLALLRRATYRSRSYAVIAAVACAVGMLQLLVVCIRHVRADGIGVLPAAYLVLGVVAGYGTVYFTHRTVDLHRQLNQSMLPPSTGEPDFTTLGDGGELADKLNHIE